jgi:hypothetical protein
MLRRLALIPHSKSVATATCRAKAGSSPNGSAGGSERTSKSANLSTQVRFCGPLITSETVNRTDDEGLQVRFSSLAEPCFCRSSSGAFRLLIPGGNGAGVNG